MLFPTFCLTALAGPSDHFASDPSWNVPTVLSEPVDLQKIARNTLDYLERHPEAPAGRIGVDRTQTVATLRAIADADPEHLDDSEWIEQTFDIKRWKSDLVGAKKHGLKPPGEQVRLTRYLVYRQQGSPVRTEKYSHALYAAPTEDSWRTKFTRQQVMAGAYRDGGEAEGQAKPLVWLTANGVHEAIMQGTVEVQLPSGPVLYNVAVNNEIAYDRSNKVPHTQKRYWYFRKVDAIAGWGKDDKVKLVPGVSVAGDVDNLGLGQVVALRGSDGVRLAVLADTGGAFQPNLYQLDFLTGTYDNKAQFQEKTKHIPRYVDAAVLTIK